MNAEFFKALDLLEKEKGIPKEYMIEKVEAALLSGFKKDNGYSNVRIELDPVKQNVRVFKQLTVVDPDLEEDIPLTAEYNFDDFDERTDRLIEIDDTTPYGDVFDDDDSGAKPAIIRRKHRFNEKTEITLEAARQINKKYNIGDTVEIEIKPKNFGRISAQTAKQVIIQGIREAERDRMVKEYESKKEEIVTAIVSRIDPVTGNAILELGKNEVTLFKNEQIPGEHYTEGDKIKVYVTVVKKETKGPSIVLSRKHPGLVKRLFELEVSEIQDGTVIIKSIAREAGSRTKIAVYSRDPNVDPIGACIGTKGIRKNSITKELAGEKIDIIKYSEVPEEFIRAALAPATVVSVTETGDRTCSVLVEDDQLSLAIGKEGQNARLAARLTGYNKIDIKSVSAARTAAFNDIIEGKTQASGSFGENLAQALKSAMDAENSSKDSVEDTSKEQITE
ncbi:MAG: transcription termination/antitermination protein NusA [Clostridiales bacterium]|nr:MAG: transcription termination/antitermination protein NusA [Clostridiales bacterium]